MIEVREYIDPDSLDEFLHRDENRILESFSYDKDAVGQEVVMFTDRMSWLVKVDNFKKGYKEMLKRFRDMNDVSNMKCKKVEFIPPEKCCGINGSTFRFKITFVK